MKKRFDFWLKTTILQYKIHVKKELQVHRVKDAVFRSILLQRWLISRDFGIWRTESGRKTNLRISGCPESFFTWITSMLTWYFRGFSNGMLKIRIDVSICSNVVFQVLKICWKKVVWARSHCWTRYSIAFCNFVFVNCKNFWKTKFPKQVIGPKFLDGVWHHYTLPTPRIFQNDRSSNLVARTYRQVRKI